MRCFKLRVYKKKASGFLLIEHLFALGIVTLSLVILMGFSRILFRVQSEIQSPDEIQWHLFLIHLNNELTGYSLIDQYHMRFQDHTPQKRLETSIKYNPSSEGEGKVFKTPGYFPMLFGFRKFQLTASNHLMKIKAQLKQGHEFQIPFASKNRVIFIRVKEKK